MNTHIFLLAFLISAGLSQASTSSGGTAFAIPPAQPSFRSTQRRTGRARQQQYGDAFIRHHRASARTSPLTTVQARRGGRGRRRGRTDGGEPAAAAAAAAAAGVAATTAGGLKETQGTAAEATLAVQHASTEAEILTVAHAHREILRPGVLSQALLRIAKPLVQGAKQAARGELLKDPKLLDLFMAASASVPAAPAAAAATLTDSRSPSAARAGGGAGGRHLLSAAQAADIVWACGLLRWLPDDGDDPPRLAQLVELVARAAASKSGLDGWHVTNVVWALDRLRADAVAGESGGLWAGSGAAGELRGRAERLPFRAIPSLFEGLRVEDFREEVAFGRDEILLGGGKVLSESRLTAWQSSDGLPFAYSGKVMEPSPFSPNVLRLRDALYERTGVLYDGVLLNLYESRSSAMRYHSDPDVGTVWTQDTSVVSVGDTRQFALRETHDHSRRHAFYLSSGDCVRMTAGCQRDYQHCVKVAKEDVGARISLVFKQSIAGQTAPGV